MFGKRKIRFSKLTSGLVAIFLLLCTTSCHHFIKNTSSECQGNQLIVSKEQFENTFSGDLFIDSISHSGLCLSMVIGFSGCDDEHDFDLIHNGDVAESYPVQISLALRDNDLQVCQAYFTKKYFFDLDIGDGVFNMEDKVTIHIKDKGISYEWTD